MAAGGTALAAGGAYTYGRWIEPQWLSVEKVEVPVPNLPAPLDGLRIAQLTDFHLDPYYFVEFFEEVVATTNRHRPDLVVHTGDFVSFKAGEIGEMTRILAPLNPPLGQVAVIGNHDITAGWKRVRAGLEAAGIRVLVNDNLTLEQRGAGLMLAGVFSMYGFEVGMRPQLDRALAGWSPEVPTLLLAHEPAFADVASRDGRVALQLSGHTHGGQVRVPGYGPLWLPKYGREYVEGLFAVGGMRQYTSRGLGCMDHPYRVWCPPELTLLTLRTA